jgi:2-amino-4-hydroxy-6-hydroxymethyldihydropteridine diphosphokinase
VTVRAYVGIGSNLNDPVAQVREAVEELASLPDTLLVARSSLYGGKPMGPQDQPDYVNAVVALDTLLSAENLLEGLQRIEQLQGRTRTDEHWGPRIIDLDLLLYGKCVIDTPGLQVPHPGLHERDFVIIPLAEVAGNLRIPGRGLLTSLINQVENHSLKKLNTGA